MTGLDAAAQLFERLGSKVSVEKRDVRFVETPKKRGRPKKVTSNEQLSQVVRLYFVEKLSMRKIAEVMGVSHMSVYRMLSDPNLEIVL